MKRENEFQPHLIARLRRMFPGCFIMKNDSGYMQGIPDLTILFNDRWAILEVKRSAKEDFEVNQEYYLELFNQMSFAACIYPENEEEVLRALQRSFEARRRPRLPQRE